MQKQVKQGDEISEKSSEHSLKISASLTKDVSSESGAKGTIVSDSSVTEVVSIAPSASKDATGAAPKETNEAVRAVSLEAHDGAGSWGIKRGAAHWYVLDFVAVCVVV